MLSEMSITNYSCTVSASQDGFRGILDIMVHPPIVGFYRMTIATQVAEY